MSKSILVDGNKKLGAGIWHWSIPALSSCPGASSICQQHCYATKAHYYSGFVRRHLQQHDELRQSREFVPLLRSFIRNNNVQLVRIHVSGDFDRVSYVRDWQTIVKACRRTQFFAYTRSWRVSRLLNELVLLGRAKNMHLWCSTDQETHRKFGAPPAAIAAVSRIAYMQLADDEPIPDYVNLVFRVVRNTVNKFIDGRLVCPTEQGVSRTLPITCRSCRLCFSDRPIPLSSRDVE